MMKSGAPPDKLGVLYHMGYLWDSMVSQAELLLRVSLFGSWSYFNFFRDGMGPLKVGYNKHFIVGYCSRDVSDDEFK